MKVKFDVGRIPYAIITKFSGVCMDDAMLASSFYFGWIRSTTAEVMKFLLRGAFLPKFSEACMRSGESIPKMFDICTSCITISNCVCSRMQKSSIPFVFVGHALISSLRFLKTIGYRH